MTTKMTSMGKLALMSTLAVWIPSASHAQDCAADEAGTVNVVSEMRYVKAALAGDKKELSKLQRLMTKSQAYVGKVDGVWGAGIESAIACNLQMYIAIGGRGDDWGVNSKKDVRRFIDWLRAAENARETGGEFPD